MNKKTRTHTHTYLDIIAPLFVLPGPDHRPCLSAAEHDHEKDDGGP